MIIEKSGPAPALIQKNANSAEHQARDMEKGVNRLIEESAIASVSGDLAGALEKVTIIIELNDDGMMS
jgi:hypothetical protein